MLLVFAFLHIDCGLIATLLDHFISLSASPHETILPANLFFSTRLNMDFQLFTDVAHALQLLSFISLAAVLCIYLQTLHFHSQIRNLPAFHKGINSEAHRKEYLKSAKRLYREGYEKVKLNVLSMGFTTD